jgi:hypothetical protein
MGYFLRHGFPSSRDPIVTQREYLHAVDRVLDAVAHESERRGPVFRHALEHLVAGRPRRAVRLFALLVERQPHDAALHRMLGISHFRSGNARLAARHLETALMLLAGAEKPGIPLVRTLRIELEASLVRFALVTAYARIGHRAGIARCLLQDRPLAWSIHPRPGG